MKPDKKELQAYHTPQVMDYGNVKQITMSNLPNGNADSGGKGTAKTHA